MSDSRKFKNIKEIDNRIVIRIKKKKNKHLPNSNTSSIKTLKL